MYGPSPSYKRDNFQAEIFSFFVDSFLLKIKCSANNPDVMMPSYKLNRLASVFFVIFSFVGTFLIMNLLTGKFHYSKKFFIKTDFLKLDSGNLQSIPWLSPHYAPKLAKSTTNCLFRRFSQITRIRQGFGR